jgi:hypothetical protein
VLACCLLAWSRIPEQTPCGRAGAIASAPQPELRQRLSPSGGPLFTPSSSCSLQPFDTHTLSSNSNKHSTQTNQPHPPNHQHVCPQRQRSQRGHRRSGHQLHLRTCFLTSTLHPLSLANNPIRTLPTTLPRPSRVPPPPPPRRPTRRRPRATSPATTPSPTVPLALLTPPATRSTRRSTRAPPRPTSRASKCTLLDEQWYGHTRTQTPQPGQPANTTYSYEVERHDC